MIITEKTRGRLLRECGLGNRAACAAAKLVIEAGSVVTFRSVDAEDEDHPNKMPFKGILLVVDEPSTKPPHGSQGHRIFVPRKVAKERLSGLMGMAVNYDKEDLDGHASRHKVGVVTKAWLDGDNVWVEGFIYKKDFPEAVKDLKDRKDLGMSMELAEVYVRDADEHVWHLQDFQFTGATILKKNAAAYYKTALAAQAAAASGKGDKMKTNKQKVIAAAGGKIDKETLAAIGEVVRTVVRPVVTAMKAARRRSDTLAEELEELKNGLVIEAAGKMDDEDAAKEDDEDAAREDDEDAAKEDDEDAAREDDEDAAKEDDDDDDDDMSAAKGGKGKKDDSEDDDDSEGEDDDDDELDAMEDLQDVDVDEEPGEIGKRRGGVNRGRKNSVTDPPRQGEKVPGNVAKGRLASAGSPFPKLKSASMKAAAIKIENMAAALQTERRKRRLVEVKAASLDLKVKKQGRLITKMDAQMERYADQETRRSAIPRELQNLAAKSNIDLYELKAAGQKMTVGQVDQIFAVAAQAGVNMEPETRMAMKNRLLEHGLMEQGEEIRS